MNPKLPLVSIICPTYNHEKYIAQALEGFLMQKTSFQFEIIVHDDASTDNTAAIVRKYERQYPEIFRNILQTENQLSKCIGNVTKIVFGASRGKYIALCEGDDYWTDPNKLQSQIDFLEQNPNFSICFHNSKIINEGLTSEISYSNNGTQKEISDFEDLASGEFIYTATCVFRNDKLKHFVENDFIYMNNYTLDLYNSQFGKIKYIDEVMSVYRKHSGGMWSMVSRKKTLISQLPTYKFYLGYFDKKYKAYFFRHLKNLTKELIYLKISTNDKEDLLKDFFIYSRYNLYDIKELIRMPLLLIKSLKIMLGNSEKQTNKQGDFATDKSI
jgi:glycosyltransferase involved in cell wall biosynthesis